MITQRIARITPSATIELEGKVAELEAAHVDVVGLNAGEPDFKTPSNIVKACADAIAAGKTKYVTVTGIAPLKEAICDKLRIDNNADYKPNQIVVSTGAKQALYNSILTICEPGDEVIIPIPAWVSYVEMVKLAEAKPILVPTKADYHLDINEIAKAVTPKTKAVIINTPNNPTGAVYCAAEMKALGQLAVEHDFYVISDEVYEKLVYGGHRFASMASFSNAVKEKTIVINGFSKAYAMTGWRIGYSATPVDIAKGISALQGHTTSNSTTFVQWAALEALTGPQDSIENMRKSFDERRAYLLGRLQSMKGITCGDAEGAFYLLPDVSSFFGKKACGMTIENSVDFCGYLLEKAKLAVVPGSAFYAPNTIRIAYSNSIENIARGMDAMEKCLADIK